MPRTLKTIDLGNGRIEKERACMDYLCRYCGAKATAANYVADLCLQVAATHNGLCGAYVESDTYTGYITECSTCAYADENENCTRD